MEETKDELGRKPVFWLILALINGLLLGWIFATVHSRVDYEAFYSAGRAAVINPHHVYDPTVQFTTAGIWHAESEFLPYYHLPNELIVFAPLSLIPYDWSLAVWRCISAGLLVLSALLLSRTLDLPRTLTVLSFAGFVPAILCVGEGQDSILLLFVLVLSYVSLHRDKQELAGIILALGLFKPQIILVVAIALLLSRRIRLFLSFVAASAGVLSVCTLYFGRGWAADLTQLIRWQEPRETPARMISLHGFVSLFRGFDPGILGMALTVVLMTVSIIGWNRSRRVDVVFGSAILVGSLVAFHIHLYDATTFLLPIALLVKIGASEWDRYAFVPFFVSPLIFFLMANRFTGFLALATMVLLSSYWRISRFTGNEKYT